jgi:putative flippase GtrA
MLLKWFQKNFKQFCLLLSGKQFRRFVFFGLICNILGVTSIYVLTEYFNIHYLLSLIIALIFVNFIGFCFNKFYTFNTDKKFFLRELVKYYNVMLSGFLLNLFCMFILVEIFKIWYMAAALIVTAVLLFFNFFLHKYWSFRNLNRLKKGRK